MSKPKLEPAVPLQSNRSSAPNVLPTTPYPHMLDADIATANKPGRRGRCINALYLEFGATLIVWLYGCPCDVFFEYNTKLLFQQTRRCLNSFDRDMPKTNPSIQSASPGHEAQARTSPLSKPEACAPVVEGRVRLATDSKARVGGVLCVGKQPPQQQVQIVTHSEVPGQIATVRNPTLERRLLNRAIRHFGLRREHRQRYADHLTTLVRPQSHSERPNHSPPCVRLCFARRTKKFAHCVQSQALCTDGN